MIRLLIPLLLTAFLGKTYLTRDQALESVFGEKSKVEKSTSLWKSKEREELAELCGTPVAKLPKLHAVYRSPGAKEAVRGYRVLFSRSKVRSKAQEIMVVLDAKDRIVEVVLCAFEEPLRYRAKEIWLAQFQGLALDQNLQLGQDIDGISGATLTARTTVAQVRELLAAARLEAARSSEKDEEEKETGGA